MRAAMRIKFLQTADAVVYRRMLAASSASTRAFCMRHGFEYETFVGLKRGWHPAHATYNRIDMLHEHVAAGFVGWLIYLDADAYVVDLDFDLAAYLAPHAQTTAIARAVFQDQAPTWNVNAGVLMVNTATPGGIALIKRWKRLLDILSVSFLLYLPPALWVTNDQQLLHLLLWRDASIREGMHFEKADLINAAYARFIAQLLRAARSNLETRIRDIEAAVAIALSRQSREDALRR